MENCPGLPEEPGTSVIEELSLTIPDAWEPRLQGGTLVLSPPELDPPVAGLLAHVVESGNVSSLRMVATPYANHEGLTNVVEPEVLRMIATPYGDAPLVDVGVLTVLFGPDQGFQRALQISLVSPAPKPESAALLASLLRDSVLCPR